MGFHTPGVSCLKPIAQTIQGITPPRTKGERPSQGRGSCLQHGQCNADAKTVGFYTWDPKNSKKGMGIGRSQKIGDVFFFSFCERSSKLEVYSYISVFFLKLSLPENSTCITETFPKKEGESLPNPLLGCPLWVRLRHSSPSAKW